MVSLALSAAAFSAAVSSLRSGFLACDSRHSCRADCAPYVMLQKPNSAIDIIRH